MGMNEQSYIKNIGVMSGGVTGISSNSPSQYSGRRKQYLGGETNLFAQEIAKYAGDYIDADCQGLNPDDFFEWTPITIRMTDVVRPSAAITRNVDDWKMILADAASIDYIPMGAKLVAMGSTWLMMNPNNISAAYGTGIARRCNGVWCHLDYYGNVLQEPIIIGKAAANATQNDDQDTMLITMGYFNLTMQKNEWTRQLKQNSRIIMGDWAFQITGPGDFTQEFTGDFDSARMSCFAARYEEPNDAIDDMATHVAGGKTFSWEILLTGASDMTVGETAQLFAESYRNGEKVSDSEENPISYIWESSDTAVAAVSDSGAITAISAGECQVTCRLAQNPQKSVTRRLVISDAVSGNYVRFSAAIPEKLEMLDFCDISAVYYENGEATSETVEWKFTGAAKSAYRAETSGNSASITCYGGSEAPLTVTASFGDASVSAEIILEGL